MIDVMKFDMGGAAATLGAAETILALQPHGVQVDFIVPAKPASAGNYRAALLASQVAPGPNGIMRRTEGSSLFYLTINPAISAPSINGARLVGTGESRRLEIDLSNSGNAHARLEGRVVIEGTSGDNITFPVSNLVVLEAGQRTFSLPVGGDLPAEPRVTIEFDNVFAPQMGGGVAPVRRWSAPLDAPRG